MSRFPGHRPETIAGFMAAYFAELGRAGASVSPAAIGRAAELLNAAVERDAQIFLCGNGGSAAIANHLVSDYAKGLRMDTGWKPRVRSLSGSTELMTAISNDLSYAEVFAFQLEGLARPGDLLISISSSGDSENIVHAVSRAKAIGVASIALTGFGGGRSAPLADVNLHVDSDNYGVVEDTHQALLHLLGQYLRMGRMPDDLIAERKF